ncbi:MAG: hypothetical protein IPK68_10685 [Bdellovibrionales bacterium]|nr:hypothetical protein [Bdellovibrionales bacterium]
MSYLPTEQSVFPNHPSSRLPLVAFLVLISTSCSKFIPIDAGEKNELLKSQSILRNPIDTSERVREPGDDTQPRNESDIKIKVTTICSQGMASGAGTYLRVAPALKIAIKRDTGQAIPLLFSDASACTIEGKTEEIRQRIYRERTIDLSSCNLPDGRYEVSLLSSEGRLKDLSYSGAVEEMWLYYTAGNPKSGLRIEIKEGKLVQTANDQTGVIEGNSYNTSRHYVLNGPNPDFALGGEGGGQGDTCDNKASPLAVQIEKGEQLSFSDSVQGVLFDIFGFRASPSPFRKARIGWIKEPNFMFLARPNSQGKINGIQELFGDNTKGPDGNFSPNGFKALAKFDGTSGDGKRSLSVPDGYIDKDDAIFSELRLWKDANLDGIAQDSEIQSLSQLKIDVIDLNYDPHFFERDALGNEIRYKSVAKRKNGELLIIFDIWFYYNTDLNRSRQQVREVFH